MSTTRGSFLAPDRPFGECLPNRGIDPRIDARLERRLECRELRGVERDGTFGADSGIRLRRCRETLCDELYLETAKYFREIRIVEIKKQEQRTKSKELHAFADEVRVD